MIGERRFTPADVLWLGLVLMVVLGLAFLLPVVPNDYWWYVRVGRDTLQVGAVPAVDTLSASQAGQPIVYQSWLSAVLFWMLYQAGGMTLTVLARGLALAITYALLYWMMREAGAGPRLAALVSLATALTGSNNWSMRPQIFAYPFFALALWILRRWDEGGRREVWLLPLVSLLWVNLHGSFILLFVLIGAALVLGNGSRRTLIAASLIALLATLINPYGLDMWRSVVGTFINPGGRNFSAEWLPPVNTGWQMNLFFGWLLLFAPLAAWSERRLKGLEWLWFLGFAWLALSGLRYGIWFVFIMAVLTGALLAAWGREHLDRADRIGIPAFDLALGILFIILPLALLPGLRERWWAQAPPAVTETPVAATAWLETHPDLPGPLWSDIAFASYLTYALPSRPVWIDTRFQVAYTADQLARYKAVNDARYDWGSILESDGINLLMVSSAAQPDLLTALAGSSTWCNQYHDETAVIYERCSKQGH